MDKYIKKNKVENNFLLVIYTFSSSDSISVSTTTLVASGGDEEQNLTKKYGKFCDINWTIQFEKYGMIYIPL